MKLRTTTGGFNTTARAAPPSFDCAADRRSCPRACGSAVAVVSATCTRLPLLAITPPWWLCQLLCDWRTCTSPRAISVK